MEQLVEVKHVLIINQSAVDTLFDIVHKAVAATYATEAEQTAAIVKAKAEFESMLNLLAHKSFKAGRKLGKVAGKSTSKDVAVL